MPNPSPSPPVPMTVRPWFAQRIPSATGSERPWMAWNPYEERKWGRLDEQPIPETMTMFWLGICNRLTAISIAATTPKSPQPGHQVGLVSDLPMRGSGLPVGVGTTRALLSAMLHHFQSPSDDLVGIERFSVVLEQ